MKKINFKALMLTLSGMVIFVFTVALMSSCQKDSIDLNDQTQLESAQKDTPLPPYSEFVCGFVPEGSTYPCPNASCPYLGYDCLTTVYVYAISHEEYHKYMDAVAILQGSINNEDVASFFTNHSDLISILMPDLTLPLDAIGQAMINDLQNGINSLKLHPVFDSESGREYYIIQVYVVATGGPPNYSDLL
ncbi:MAG: hypothetical protein PHU97_08860 [Bacteroidales bacterium]|nr:hypothetical protein [Bacteroidales bacterium]MDD3011414.1 hypothetical protein [Bacteroidales bacterium]MDD3962764.1 hypothetical protein [Bacteroidales bacterium]MDY0285671.1 hypothetical protein [Bacteroidales bacterium]